MATKANKRQKTDEYGRKQKRNDVCPDVKWRSPNSRMDRNLPRQGKPVTAYQRFLQAQLRTV